jgi:MFS superfamily sulfate permease-like transporter
VIVLAFSVVQGVLVGVVFAINWRMSRMLDRAHAREAVLSDAFTQIGEAFAEGDVAGAVAAYNEGVQRIRHEWV